VVTRLLDMYMENPTMIEEPARKTTGLLSRVSDEEEEYEPNKE
jgi:hypothetical protein